MAMVDIVHQACSKRASSLSTLAVDLWLLHMTRSCATFQESNTGYNFALGRFAQASLPPGVVQYTHTHCMRD